ncbi:uncharacterized protein [Rutidosis leptorrhynchoides]|uniref:uncharacterized protein isoform X2 n=1 Tax=Rutidosis leptorrhynchoides TaxID=125765 RepID=UPI003A9A155B
MRNPPAALKSHLRRYSSPELQLFYIIIIFIFFLSFSIQSIDSISNNEEPVEWQILTKNNYSSQIRINPHILLIVTVPWSGESRSLMKELAQTVTKKKEEFGTLKLMFMYKNHDKVLTDALGAIMETNIICYHHSLPYKYQGTLRVQNILSSVRYLMSLLPEETPLKHLKTADDLTTFVSSTDKALLVLEFCGWTPKLIDKVMNNGSKNAFGVSLGKGLYEEPDETSSADEKKNQGMKNEKITCDVDNQFSEFAPFNESDFLEAEKTRSGDRASCTFDEYQLFASSLYNFTSLFGEFFLPPERLKFGLVTEKSLISSLGVGDTTGSWLMMLYSNGCPDCAKVFRGGGDFKKIIEIDESPVMELKGDEDGFNPGLPSDKPSVLLFIDRSSDSLEIRRKSFESLTILRELALPNHIPFKSKPVNPQKTISQHPKLEMSTSSHKVTALDDKITIMALKDGSRITVDDVASHLQDNSLQEVLAYVLQQKKQRKLSSLAKDVGFRLISDDIDVTMSETDIQSIKGGDTLLKEMKVSEKINVDTTADFENKKVEKGPTYNCSFFFIDGNFRLLEGLTSVIKIPSLVIIDPVSHQHYVYPEEADFSVSSLSNFLDLFFNQSLLPYQRSKSVVPDSKEAPHPPFVNQDFHEVDSIPRVSARTFMDLVVGNRSGSFNVENALKKDVLVLFTSSWCGFCMRTELVVREVYRAFKGYGNMVKRQYRNDQSSLRNDGVHNTKLKLPVIYMMDCIENDCSLLLKSLPKGNLYPSLMLYPAEGTEAISYEGEISVSNIIKFIADQGRNSHWIYNERGILWTEHEDIAWNEQPFKTASEPVIQKVVSLSKESNKILLKDQIQTQSLETKNKVKPHMSSEFGHDILPGSVLIATQKLYNVYPFSESKILIVDVNQSIGFQGVIINKFISWDTISGLEDGFESLKEAPLSYGGPVITRGLPLVSLSRQSFKNEHPEVLPNIYFLDQSATITLIQNLKLHNRSMTDYWFFVGYSAWVWNQLFDEIKDGSWNISNGTSMQVDWPIK